MIPTFVVLYIRDFDMIYKTKVNTLQQCNK